MKNMGTTDRVIRVIVVGAIGAAYLLDFIGGPLALVLGGVAVVFLLTSVFATCPGYIPFGISTRPRS